MKKIFSALGVFIGTVLWSVLWTSILWTIRLGYDIIEKLVHPEVYFHSWHFPLMAPFFGVLFTLATIIFGEIYLLLSRKGGKKNRGIIYSACSLALVLIFYTLAFIDLKSGIFDLVFDFNTVKGITWKLITLNLAVITGIILLLPYLFRFISRIYPVARKLWIIALAAVGLCYVLNYVSIRIDPNRLIFPDFEGQDFAKGRPNVLLIVVDNLRADFVGGYGKRAGLTPNIDKIAEEGIIFENMFSASNWTSASFAAIYTSMYPYRIFVSENRPEVADSVVHMNFYYPINKIDSTAATITSLFKDNGYLVSTFQANYQAGWKFGFNANCNFYLACYNRTKDGVFFYFVYSALEKAYNSLIKSEPEQLSYFQRTAVKKYCAEGENLANYSINFMDRNKDKSFFQLINFMDVHEYRKRVPQGDEYDLIINSLDTTYNQNNYAANLAYCDQQIGRIYAYLKEADVLDNTILLICSDHGEQFGEHGEKGEHGFSMFKEEFMFH